MTSWLPLSHKNFSKKTWGYPLLQKSYIIPRYVPSKQYYTGIPPSPSNNHWQISHVCMYIHMYLCRNIIKHWQFYPKIQNLLYTYQYFVLHTYVCTIIYIYVTCAEEIYSNIISRNCYNLSTPWINTYVLKWVLHIVTGSKGKIKWKLPVNGT